MMLTKFIAGLFTDEDQQRRAKILLGTQLLGFLLVTILICYTLIMTPDHPETLWQGLMGLLAFTLSFLLLRQKRIKAASWLVAVIGWGVFTQDLIFVGGISGISILGQILMVMFTGLAINGVSAIILTFITLIVNFLIMQAEVNGLITNLATVPPGELRWFIQTIYGVLAAYYIWLTDLVIREALSRSRQAADQYRALFDLTSDGVVMIGLDWKILSVNPQALLMFGYLEEEFVGMEVNRWEDFEDPDLMEKRRSQILSGEDLPTFEEILIKKGGKKFNVEMSLSLVNDSDNRPHHVQCIIRDITERKEYEQQLKHQALHDPLTKLPNRILFEDRYQMAHSDDEKDQSLVALLFVDLDNFKQVNDDFGHAVGDQVLMKLGDRMQSALRESDTVARLGGDEFVIFLENIHNKNDVRKVAKKIQQHISQPMLFDGHSIMVTASIGINIAEKGNLSKIDLIKTSDTAMYRVKEDGKNDVRFYDTAPRE